MKGAAYKNGVNYSRQW